MAALVAACGLSVLYLTFVLHYSVNGLLLDDWGFVHLVDASIHGHLTLTELWTQHNENRMFVPNAILVALAVATHDNTRTAMVISALLFIASYVLFLVCLANYLGRRLSVLPVVATGVIWFSLTDWQNALWGFQFAWYLILFLLMAMLCLLLVGPDGRHRTLAVCAAITAAIAASYSSAQGEFLWPVGLVCLLWPVRGMPQAWARRTQRHVAIWIVAGVITTAMYFLGFTQSVGGDFVTTLSHAPMTMVESVLANIGEVVPTSAPDVPFHVVLGLVLLLGAGFVVVQSLRQRRDKGAGPLPVCLILFALLFDPPIASIRLLFGVVPTLAPRYTMANLMIPIAIVSYALSRVATLAEVRGGAAPWPHVTVARKLGIGALVCFVLIQVIVSTRSGIARASESRASMIIGSRLVVNDNLAPADRRCYAFAVEEYAGEVGDPLALAQAREDQLGPFSRGLYHLYRAGGPPSVCR